MCRAERLCKLKRLLCTQTPRLSSYFHLSLHLPSTPNPPSSATINALIRGLQLLISLSSRSESSSHRGSMDGEISNIKKWIILYPIYINSKKTIAEGRRISTSKACENPTCAEIGDCCSHLKLPFAIEGNS
ncbi:signal recognition particle SEC65 subunit-like [Camellia sinensis]|uniref:signal recognition particle SEC65 subunit-like n=1 Tax=Camellia sinensis TaxID=4442 RepID=UPI001036E8FD|nr:signal recognition particle SEC65 subunit-like [Camellia sinensis]